jgi:hypothetical protein
MFLSASRASAQARTDSLAAPFSFANLVNSGRLVTDAHGREPQVLWATPRVSNQSKAAVSSGRHRSVSRKVLGAAIGAVGGLFAGGFLGAKIEGNSCDCDDPGLMGALIGAPIGAITGGILGAKFF